MASNQQAVCPPAPKAATKHHAVFPVGKRDLVDLRVVPVKRRLAFVDPREQQQADEWLERLEARERLPPSPIMVHPTPQVIPTIPSPFVQEVPITKEKIPSIASVRELNASDFDLDELEDGELSEDREMKWLPEPAPQVNTIPWLHVDHEPVTKLKSKSKRKAEVCFINEQYREMQSRSPMKGSFTVNGKIVLRRRPIRYYPY